MEAAKRAARIPCARSRSHLVTTRIAHLSSLQYPCVIALLASVACGDSHDCESFIHASIAEMRNARGSGCFELQHVVVVARSPSTVTPRVYVQDPDGGALSAIMAKCDGTSSHACASGVADTVHSAIDGDAVTVRGYYQQGSVTGFEELYVSEFTREGSLLPTPARSPRGRPGRSRASTPSEPLASLARGRGRI